MITHMDSDGVISSYLIAKYVEMPKKILFSNPSIIRDSIAKSIIGETDLDKIYITDIAGNDHAVHLSSVFNKAYWLDHHQWTVDKKFDNVEIYIMPEPSAAQVVSNVFKINDYMVEIANHIDQNDIRSEEESYFRDLISAIRLYKGKFTEKYLADLVINLTKNNLENIIKENLEMIESFRKYTNEIRKKIENNVIFLKIKGKKIAIVETEENIPVYKIEEALDPNTWDVLIVKFLRMNRDYAYTKLELRSKGLDVLKIARAFGGGGHLQAAGAAIPGILSLDDVLNSINLFI